MEKKGAVLIELPENLAAQMVPKLPLPVTPIPTSTPGPQALESVCSLLGQYQKPLVITGNGVIRQGAIKELATFAEKLKSPVIHSFMAKGVLPKDHPQNFFTFGLSEQDEVLPIIEEADLLIVIGYDFVEKPPKDWNKKAASRFTYRFASCRNG